MRIYHDTYPTVWDVVHVPTASIVVDVLWVDTDSARYCVAAPPPCISPAGEYISREVQAKRIDAFPDRGLILIDPVDDDNAQDESSPTTAPELAHI